MVILRLLLLGCLFGSALAARFDAIRFRLMAAFRLKLRLSTFTTRDRQLAPFHHALLTRG